MTLSPSVSKEVVDLKISGSTDYQIIVDAEVNEIADDYETGADRVSIEDMMVNSNYMNQLNGQNRSVAMVNIVCEENSRPALRVGNADSDPPEQPDLHTYDDGDMIRTVNNIEAAYKTKRIFHEIKRFMSPFLFVYHNKRANAWGRGEDYLDDKLDAEYSAIIGANRKEWRTRKEWVEICDDGCNTHWLARSVNSMTACVPVIDPNNCRWEQRTISYQVFVSESSDGFVPQGTQQYDPVPNENVYFADGVNHLEVGNHRAMTDIFNEIFDRTDDFEVVEIE
jgi:hypothetical protein